MEKKIAKTTETETPEAKSYRDSSNFITIRLSKQEKERIVKEAVQDNGVSITEFVRTKIFAPPAPKVETPELSEAAELDDFERTIYENKLKELSDENKKLKDEIVKTKVLNTDLSKPAAVPAPVNATALNLELEPELKAFIDRIKQYREEKQTTLDEDDKATFLDWDKFIKQLLFRGLLRSYNGGVLKESTGLTTAELKEVVKALNMDYDEV